MATYRLGRNCDDIVYLQHGDQPADADERVAVFTRDGGEKSLDALHYVRAMNATMPDCTCRVICDCGALVGATTGCEGCEEHTAECLPDPLTDHPDA